MSDTKIIIACHKKIDNLPSFPEYLALEVGASNHINNFLINKDNSGDNISEKNPSFCELTGIYWAYKNLNYNIIGLVHYRRFFMKSFFCIRKKVNNVIKEKEIKNILSSYDIILPKKRHYYIETNYTHYIHAHKKEALDITREIIKNNFPDYSSSFEKHLRNRSGHYFNMFIAKKEIAEPMLDWMFSILFELEKRINVDEYVDAEKRVFGYISELLFDTYCESNELRIKNQKYLFFEKQNRVLKIFNFVKRKVKGE